jgi:crotonobetainyl-CoA:carnitine CoA-transferase CaiB-like acyl-CoA transferase
LAGESAAVVVGALATAGVRATPVVERDGMVADPWLAENAFMETIIETPYGLVRNNNFADFSLANAAFGRPEPGLGEHSFEILADWGIDSERIARLGADGIIMRLC